MPTTMSATGGGSKGTATASHGSGSGAERGGGGSGHAFGNTVKFETAFSAKSFAQYKSRSSIEVTGGKHMPMFNASLKDMRELSPKKGFSPGMHRPQVSPFRKTEPLSLVQHKAGIVSSDTARPFSLKETKPLYSFTSQPEIRSSAPKAYERPPVEHRFGNTVERKATGNMNHEMKPHRREGNPVLYQRPVAGARKLEISPSGRIQTRVGSSEARHAPVKTKPEGKTAVHQEVVKRAGKERLTSGAVRKQLERKQAVQGLLKDHRVMEAKAPQELKKALNERFDFQALPEHQIKTSAKPLDAASIKVVSAQETQAILKAYTEKYVAPKGAEAVVKTPAVLDQLPAEVQADLEQAARVKAAFAAVNKSYQERGLAEPLTNQEMQDAVLRSVDQKLEKTHLKTAVAATGAEHTEYTSPNAVELESEAEPANENRQTVGTITDAEQVMTPVVLPQEAVETGKTHKSGETLPYTQPETTTEQTGGKTAPFRGANHTYQQTQSGARYVSVKKTLEETEEDEEAEVLAEEEQLEAARLKHITFVREEPVDENRRLTALEAAAVLFEANSYQPITGEDLVTMMGISEQPEGMKSSLVRGTEQPDGSLSEIGDNLRHEIFTSAGQVERRIHTLTAAKPAVTIGNPRNVSEQDVDRVLRRDYYRARVSA